jgi:hypothetical protein
MKLKPLIQPLKTSAGVVYGCRATMKDPSSVILASKEFIAERASGIKASYNAAVSWCRKFAEEQDKQFENPLTDHESAFLIKRAKDDVKNFEFNKDRIHKGGAMGLLEAVEYAGSGKAKHAITNLRRRLFPPKKFGNPLNRRERKAIAHTAAEHDRDSRTHKTCYLKGFDKGTAAGMREAVAMSRKNPYIFLKKGTHVGISMWHSEKGKGLDYPPFTGILLEDMRTGGWDVADIMGDDGVERSVYAFSIYKKHKNPLTAGGRFAQFTHKRLEEPSHFDPRSFRTKHISPTKQLLIGCPKGHYIPSTGLCGTGTRAQALLTRKNSLSPETQKIRNIVKNISGVRYIHKWSDGAIIRISEKQTDSAMLELKKYFKVSNIGIGFDYNAHEYTLYISLLTQKNPAESDWGQVYIKEWYRHSGRMGSIKTWNHVNEEIFNKKIKPFWEKIILNTANHYIMYHRPVDGNTVILTDNTRKNPPAPASGAVLIGRQAKAVEYYDAQKARAEGLGNPSRPWRHDYKRGAGAKVYGLADGSVLLKGKKKLWAYR